MTKGPETLKNIEEGKSYIIVKGCPEFFVVRMKGVFAMAQVFALPISDGKELYDE